MKYDELMINSVKFQTTCGKVPPYHFKQTDNVQWVVTSN